MNRTPGLFSIRSAAASAARAPCVVGVERSYDHEQVARGAEAAWRFLSTHDVAANQAAPVAFVARNDLNSIFTLLALIEFGVAAMPLHPRWSAEEREAYLGHGAPAPHAAQFIELPTAPFEFDTALDFDTAPPIHAGTLPPKGTLCIVHTSGSAGEPRGVMLSRGAFGAAVRASASNLGWREDDAWLLSLSLAHVGGLSIVLRCLAARRPMVMPAYGESGGFDAQRLLQTARRCNTTLMSVVPTQLTRLLDEGSPPASLRAVLVGGAAASEGLLRRALDAGWPVLPTYGSTETCSQVATQSPATLKHPERLLGGGTGPLLEGVEARFDDGRILIRSRALLTGYYPDDPAPLDEDGFFRTNDMGALDDRGNLHVQGRLDDVILSGGENVFPLEVEAALTAHADVTGACVFGIDDAEYGQVVAALIVTRSGHVPTDLMPHLAARLATFKRPRLLALGDHLATGTSGKVQRHRVAAAHGARCQRVTYR